MEGAEEEDTSVANQNWSMVEAATGFESLKDWILFLIALSRIFDIVATVLEVLR
ncbi:unnamed protein product [Brassica oleracea]|uniref:(rape) hypothetical protein n=1 Tax=Brassica napus TaxID=3708 RepID=A0A816JNP6_BRANA|nr:unnamed protein product [Brassica napus]